jgi:hypothetical protein
MPSLTLHPVIGSERVVNLLFTIGFGVIGLVGIIYSLLFLPGRAVGRHHLHPRLGLFRDDPVVWRTSSPSASSSSASPQACPSAPAKKSRSRSR